MVRARLRIACALVGIGLASASATSLAAATRRGPVAQAGCSGDAWRDTIESADAAGEIRLGSSRRIRLVDIRLAVSGDDAGADRAVSMARAVLTSLSGRPVTVTPVGEPDRWNRVPAFVALAEGSIDLGELLVSEGLAVVDTGERSTLCRAELLKSEAVARSRRLGLWAGVWPLPAGDVDGLRARAGRFAILDGRVVSVGERSWRTYLNFGRDFSRDAAVVIPRGVWRQLKATGLDAAALKGRRVRVRGVVDLHRAPSVEIDSPAMLEVLPDDAARP